MFKHVVMWKFTDNAEGQRKEYNMKQHMDALLALPPVIPQIKSLHVGTDLLHTENSYDLALVSEFDTESDFNIYRDHPEHKKIGEVVSKTTCARASVDFEY